jgi:hypothetical protein
MRQHSKSKYPTAKQIGKEPCVCGDPLPCVYPVPDCGVECDNCGGWLAKDEGDAAGQSALNEALNVFKP